MLVVPVFYLLLDDLREWVLGRLRRPAAVAGPGMSPGGPS